MLAIALELAKINPVYEDIATKFFEHFHGDNGAGIGASHQTGWTGLVAKLIQQFGRANRDQIVQIVSHLLENAIQYSEERRDRRSGGGFRCRGR